MERLLNGRHVGVRAFRQQIDDQLITVFGCAVRTGPAPRSVTTTWARRATPTCRAWRCPIPQALSGNVRGSVDYSVSSARWTERPAGQRTRGCWQRIMPPRCYRASTSGFTTCDTSIEAEVPQTATRVVVFYRINNAFMHRRRPEEMRGLDGRFEMQVTSRCRS